MYGIYQGGDNPKLPKIGGDFRDKYDDYSLEPIDETDRTAKQHDLDYDNAGKLAGLPGILNGSSTDANLAYNKSADKIISKYEKGQKDDVTGKPVTKETADAAKFGKKWFSIAETIKGKPKVDVQKPERDLIQKDNTSVKQPINIK